jgi:excisionase family DNA binding protein
MRDLSKRWTYTVEEAGEMLGIGRNQAYEAARRGEIPTIKAGNRILVPKAKFHRMLGLTESPDEMPEAVVESGDAPPPTTRSPPAARKRGRPPKAPTMAQSTTARGQPSPPSDRKRKPSTGGRGAALDRRPSLAASERER